MSRSLTFLCGLLFISPLASANVIKLDFEAFPDSTSLTNQYLGFLFTNTSVWTAGLSLDDLEFPPSSGANVAVDTGGPITITFSTPVLAVSGFFTYSSPLTINGFDSLDQIVGTTNSLFSSNFVSSSNPPNELLGLSFVGGISSVTITGDPSGLSFALDDLTVVTPLTNTPEPSSAFTALAGLLLVGIASRRRFAN